MNANATIRYCSMGQVGLLFWKEKCTGSVVIPLYSTSFYRWLLSAMFSPREQSKVNVEQ